MTRHTHLRGVLSFDLVPIENCLVPSLRPKSLSLGSWLVDLVYFIVRYCWFSVINLFNGGFPAIEMGKFRSLFKCAPTPTRQRPTNMHLLSLLRHQSGVADFRKPEITMLDFWRAETWI